MKAAILEELKKPLVIADIELPKTLQYGQVLVKVLVSGVCGSQIGEIDGVKGYDKFLPHLLGHEGCGIVEDTGPGVITVAKGDKVVLHWRKGFGIESATPKYKWGQRDVNAGWVTTFNEYAVVAENRVTTVPQDMDEEVAALMGCAVTTGLGVINNNAQLKIGESIAVFGAGGVGLNIIQGAALVSANPIIAIDIFDSKLEMAKRFGATHAINSKKQDPVKEIRDIVGARGVDVAVENTGVVAVIEAAYEVTAPDGRTVLVGVPPAGNKATLYTLPLHFEKILTGSHGGEANPSKEIPRYVNLFNKGRMSLKEMITHRFTLDDINEAVSAMRKGEVGRCMIKVSG